MSLPQETLIELMSLADGQLEGDAKVRVEKLVAESEEARAVLDGFRAPHVGIWLAESFDRRASAAGADGIADRIMAELSGEVPASAKVVRIADRQQRGASSAAASRRGLLFASVLGVTAVAAGIAVLIKSTARPGGDQMPVASVGMPSVDLQPPPVDRQSSAQGVEVDEVDSPSRGISVFEIPLTHLAGAAANVGPRSGSSVVVWIDDEGAK
jgi:hypothetical protein